MPTSLEGEEEGTTTEGDAFLLDDSGNVGSELSGSQGQGQGQNGEVVNSDEYKTLSDKHGQTTNELAELNETLEQYGGLDNISALGNLLQDNPRFQEFIQSENAIALRGEQVPGENNPERIEATNIIKDIVQKELGQNVNPFMEQIQRDKVNEAINEMDKQYSKEGKAYWREMQSDMQVLAKDLPLSVQSNISVKTLEGLYYNALANAGKLDNFTLQRATNLANRQKSLVSDFDNVGSGITGKQAMTFQEASDQACQTLGLN